MLLVETYNTTQSKNLKKITRIANQSVTIEGRSTTLNTVKGVVHSVTFGQTTDELLECLEDQGVTDLKLITIKRNNELIQTNSCILTFKKHQLPSVIKLSQWHNEVVHEY